MDTTHSPLLRAAGFTHQAVLIAPGVSLAKIIKIAPGQVFWYRWRVDNDKTHYYRDLQIIDQCALTLHILRGRALEANSKRAIDLSQITPIKWGCNTIAWLKDVVNASQLRPEEVKTRVVI